MDPSRSRRLVQCTMYIVYAINNCEGPRKIQCK